MYVSFFIRSDIQASITYIIQVLYVHFTYMHYLYNTHVDYFFQTAGFLRTGCATVPCTMQYIYTHVDA